MEETDPDAVVRLYNAFHLEDEEEPDSDEIHVLRTTFLPYFGRVRRREESTGGAIRATGI